MNYCDMHHAHDSRIERSEKDIQDIWKSIDRMRMWVVVGMGSLLLNVCIVLFKFILDFIGKS